MKFLITYRSDPQIQSIVYKLVPSLYTKEIQRREDFYRSTGVRASSSCSDDSVIDRERDMINEQEKMVSILTMRLLLAGRYAAICLLLYEKWFAETSVVCSCWLFLYVILIEMYYGHGIGSILN